MDPLVDEGDLAKDGHVSGFFYLLIRNIFAQVITRK
jgi:hypothetical protein